MLIMQIVYCFDLGLRMFLRVQCESKRYAMFTLLHIFNFKDDLKRKFLLMQMNRTLEL